MEHRAAGIDMPHHIDGRLNIEWLTQDCMAHATARCIGHFTFLNVKPSLQKLVEIACVIKCRCVMMTSAIDAGSTPIFPRAVSGAIVSLRLRRSPPTD